MTALDVLSGKKKARKVKVVRVGKTKNVQPNSKTKKPVKPVQAFPDASTKVTPQRKVPQLFAKDRHANRQRANQSTANGKHRP